MREIMRVLSTLPQRTLLHLLPGKKHTAAEYCARIAGILAGLSLSRSSTFYVLNDVSSAEVPDDPNERIDAGELILTFDGSQYKIGRGVNSLTSFYCH